jgi:hypothetical protein
MQSLIYQRSIIGYHGCCRSLVHDVLLGKQRLNSSHNDYDWLGSGIYFWEYGYQRALDWAEGIHQRRPKVVKVPAAIGAHIHLGVCFDLLDVRFTTMLAELYPLFELTLKKQGATMPENAPAHGSDRDLVLRKLDCAMLNWAIPQIEKALGVRFQTVRGVFQEGLRAYPGSGILKKSHIQVVVRDSEVILGYFLPEA